MEDLKTEKSDVVREILDNTDLLNIFADSLKDPQEQDHELYPVVTTTTTRAQKIRYYLWKKIKESLCFISNKIQVLAVLAEYNFRTLEKKLPKNKQEI